MSIKISEDPRWSGLLDGVMSGWFLQDSNELVRDFPVSAQDRVLDFGCGAGESSVFCAQRGAHITIADIDADKLARVQQRLAQSVAGSFRSILMRDNKIPLESGSMTRIIAMDVLEHTREPSILLDELVRVGAPGAKYVISVPDRRGEEFQRAFAPATYFEEPNHIQLFDTAAFARLIAASGLKIEAHTTHGFFWLMHFSLYWLTERAQGRELEGAAMDRIAEPYHPLLLQWATLWQQILRLPDGALLKQAFDATLPKGQCIIAVKPG
jgi:2-polyprenyl-3-methyl-5-hydroxy-6-metoxy-1,4-benzoquinol methylase